MKKQIFSFIITLSITSFIWCQNTDIPMVGSPLDKNDNLPQGWFKSGTQPQDYSVGIDRSISQEGESSAYIRSKELKPSGSCDLIQEIKSDNYRGERIRFSAYVKTKFVANWAGLYMIIEDAAGRPIAFDNMQNRPLVGTSDWVQYEIVLDVPQQSENILFGASLHGKGEIWFDNLKLLVVNKNIPVTDLSGKTPSALYPENMDFEK